MPRAQAISRLKSNDVSLLIEIKNKQPVELIDLTKSLISLGNQFNNYTLQSGDQLENREGRLYVKEIKTGSIILELIQVAMLGMLPFAENVNTIVGFAEFLQKAYRSILNKNNEKPKEFTA